MKTVFKLILLSHFMIVGVKAQSLFESKKLSDTYSLLPSSFQAQVMKDREGEAMFFSDNLLKGSKGIKVVYNDENQISHLGFDIFSQLINEKYRLAANFIEHNFLYYYLLKNRTKVFDVTKREKVSLLLNNKEIDVSTQIPPPEVFSKEAIDFKVENDYFNVSWLLENSTTFSIIFPCEINTIMSMDKSELESELNRQLKSAMVKSITSTDPWKKLKGRAAFQKMPNDDIYVQVGDKFYSDDFRSDIYVFKDPTQIDTSRVYTPIFDEKYPRESLQNLFICNLASTLEINITQVMYGGKREKVRMPLTSFFNYFGGDHTTYFALQKDDGVIIKATIVLYNPIYLYAHMLTISTEKTSITQRDGLIEAVMYPYIPHRNFFKDEYIHE